MKIKATFYWTFIFFIGVNTAYFWEGHLGFLALIFHVILFVVFFLLALLFLLHIIRLVQERGAKFERLLLIAFLSFVLFATYLRPQGWIDYEQFEGKDVYEAHREGGGNCQMRLKLKDTGKFVYKTRCFRVDEQRGYYELKEDTIFFKTKEGTFIDDFYTFGITKKYKRSNGTEGGTIYLYTNNESKYKNMLVCLKDELSKKNNPLK